VSDAHVIADLNRDQVGRVERPWRQMVDYQRVRDLLARRS
jgi:hypothetical protein